MNEACTITFEEAARDVVPKELHDEVIGDGFRDEQRTEFLRVAEEILGGIEKAGFVYNKNTGLGVGTSTASDFRPFAEYTYEGQN